MAIRLFDIAAKIPGMAWSTRVWRTRYVLNYKKLPYETTWVEFSDIQSKCEQLGVITRSKHYTLPVIQDPKTGTASSGPWNIVDYLESTYPPPDPARMLLPPGTHESQLQLLTAIHKRIGVLLLPLTSLGVVNILDSRSAELFKRKNKPWFRPKMVEAERVRQRWRELEEGLGVIASGMEADSLFLGGGEWPTYMDFEMASWMISCRTIWGEGSTEWEKIAKWHDGRWGRLLEALKEYEQVV